MRTIGRLRVSVLIQILLSLSIVLAAVAKLLPADVATWLTVVVLVLKELVHVAQAFSNPDGTPASVAYEPPEQVK